MPIFSKSILYLSLHPDLADGPPPPVALLLPRLVVRHPLGVHVRPVTAAWTNQRRGARSRDRGSANHSSPVDRVPGEEPHVRPRHGAHVPPEPRHLVHQLGLGQSAVRAVSRDRVSTNQGSP